MMKKLFFLFCALMLIGIGAWAQDEGTDFTKWMDTNNASSWTAPQSGTGPTAVSYTSEGTATTHIEENISTGAATGKVLYQTIYGLPAGTYDVKFYAFARLQRGLSASLWAGDDKTQGYAKAGSSEAITKNISIPSTNYSSFSGWSEDDVITIENVKLNYGDALEYGIQNADAGGQWFGIEAISLMRTTAGETLQEGVVEECEAELAHWSISGDNASAIECNDWFTEENAAGMTKPFIEYWAGEGNELPAATISHYDIMCLPKGYYKVSVLARAVNEGGGIGNNAEISTEKIYFTAGEGENNKVDITMGTKGTSGDPQYYGTYEIVCYLGNEEPAEGSYTLKNIGFEVAEGSNCSWLSWKNLKVDYLGSELTYSIGEPQCSAMVAVSGQEVSIVFNDCIYPEEASSNGELKLSDTAKITVNGTEVTEATLTTEGYTATVTFTMPDISTDDVTISVPAGLIYWDISSQDNVVSEAATFTLTTQPFSESLECLIINAANDYYFGGGLQFGTTGTQLAKPQFFVIEPNEDGTYKLNSHQYNSDTEHYLGSNLNVGTSGADWIIAHNEGDIYTIYNAAAGGYLTGNGFQEAVTGQTTPSETSYWKFITMKDVEASMADASMNNPVDVTALIGAPELKRNSNVSNESNNYTAPWTVTGTVSFGSGSATANCAESSTSFSVSQTITLPKAGTYLLSAQAFYRGTTSNVPYLFAGNQTSEFLPLTSNISSMADAYQAFLAGDYTVEAISIVAENESTTVNIGFKCEDASLWNVMGELELLYLGTAEEIEWTMYDVGWGTLILPFDADIPDDGYLTLYPGDEILVSGSDLLFGTPATSIKANTPYLVMSDEEEIDSTNGTTYKFTGYPTNDADSYTLKYFVGTMVDMKNDDFVHDGTEYVLQNHEDEGLNFYPITNNSSGVTLNAYHCYMVLNNNSVQPSSLNIPAVLSAGRYNDDTTGIVAVERDAIVNEAIYDLSGRRVAKATKGVYIINGKKVLVK